MTTLAELEVAAERLRAAGLWCLDVKVTDGLGSMVGGLTISFMAGTGPGTPTICHRGYRVDEGPPGRWWMVLCGKTEDGDNEYEWAESLDEVVEKVTAHYSLVNVDHLSGAG
jgi:hypothetical protein